jgi:hypoxanthine phosphoribosyltransferase
MSTITVHNKTFTPYIDSEKIQKRISELATEIKNELNGEVPVFIGVLNGAFRFASDLYANLDINCEIEFIKLASYQGTESTGKVREMAGLKGDLSGRHVIIIEDIVDTGHTLKYLIEELSKKAPKSIKTATLLYKPEAYKGEYPIEYIGFEIPELFVVGYGLDFDGHGRNLNDIFQIKN